MVFTERQPVVAAAAVASVLLSGALASALIFASYRLDLETLAQVRSLIDLRPVDADLFRWGALVDMLGYIAFALVPIYLHGRLIAIAPEQARQGLVGMITFCGLGWSLVGAIGGALMASVGPHLLDASSGNSAAAAAADVAFGALASSAYVGLWGTLELLFYGAWLMGVGWLTRSDGQSFRWMALVGGLGALGYSARTGLAGHPPIPFASPLDILILVGVAIAELWLLWLAARLWRGR